MTEQIKLIECPRDAWQGLPEQIPTEYKAEYLKELVHAGFKHIDAVSFVSPKHVKQMADSEEVMAKLNASLLHASARHAGQQDLGASAESTASVSIEIKMGRENRRE